MSVSGNFLTDLGIDGRDLFAGAAGGLVRHVAQKKRGEPWTWADAGGASTSMLAGALCAAYLGEPIGRFFGYAGGAATFLVGMTGLVLCQMAVDQVVRRFKLGGGEGGPPG